MILASTRGTLVGSFVSGRRTPGDARHRGVAARLSPRKHPRDVARRPLGGVSKVFLSAA